MSDSVSQKPAVRASDADGHLLALVIAGLYGLLTLNSTNQVALWPWVALWQGAMILPLLWLLWQLWHKPLARFRLGWGMDWLMAGAIVGLAVSTLVADFSQQALWYAIASLAGGATLYGLMGWLTPARLGWLLKGQAYLSLVFVAVSLGWWLLNIYRPELQRLAALEAYGLQQTFDLNTLGLRNWFPLGHQNYVAGYLLLVLPLLAGLAFTDQTWQRWLWAGGLAVGLVDLYTTNSRGATLALLALVVPAIAGLLLTQRVARRWVVPISLGGIALIGLFVFTNSRVRLSLVALGRGDVNSGQLAYRLVNNMIGWSMGWQRPWAGLGPGSVLPFYQHHRPGWAGREAELHYQLHSTPAQLWGELGLWGILLPIAGAVLLGWALWQTRAAAPDESRLPRSLRWSLIAGLWAYGVLSLTDYQLDVVAIAGVLIIFIAVLLFDLRSVSPEITFRPAARRRRRSLVLVGLGLVLALVLWLIPLHRAWAISARGFGALQKADLPGFVADLQQAHQLAPGEPYYPFMLGWVLGDVSYQVEDPDIVSQLRRDAIAGFEQGNEISPFQEFGHSNLGWLLLPETPTAAIAQFAQSAELLPAKQGVFYGLGYSLYLAGETDLAVEAIALEILRNPTLLTNLPLNDGALAELQPAVLARIEDLVRELLAAPEPEAIAGFLHQIRGAGRWWDNDYVGALADWEQSNNTVSLALLAIAQDRPIEMNELPDSPGKFALQAWQDPANRRQWLETAWLAYVEGLPQLASPEPPADQITALLDSMNEAATFDQWLKETVPFTRLRSERLGFGVLLRHDDGPNPEDFYFRWENLAIARFFASILPSPQFAPALDNQLQPHRDALLEAAVRGIPQSE